MVPLNFKEANAILKGEEGSGVMDLPVLQNEADQTSTSLWAPDEDDMKILLAGGAISVGVIGQHPPLKVGVVKITVVK